jgi:hypothetical protein
LLLLACWLLRVYNTLFDVACQTEEGFFDVDVALCADFHERDAKLVC